MAHPGRQHGPPAIRLQRAWPPGSRIALLDPNVEGNPVIAIQEITSVESLSDAERAAIIAQVFGTDDDAHPGVAAFKAAGDTLIAGPIEVLNFSYFPGDFPATFRTAVELRAEIAERGWNRVVAFQTRNPMHRAHEELCRMAQQAVEADGILIHMLLGKLKPGDIPADVRDASIRKMVELYFPENTVMIAGYGFDMLYRWSARGRAARHLPPEQRLHAPDRGTRPRGRWRLLRSV